MQPLNVLSMHFTMPSVYLGTDTAQPASSYGQHYRTHQKKRDALSMHSFSFYLSLSERFVSILRPFSSPSPSLHLSRPNICLSVHQGELSSVTVCPLRQPVDLMGEVVIISFVSCLSQDTCLNIRNSSKQSP